MKHGFSKSSISLVRVFPDCFAQNFEIPCYWSGRFQTPGDLVVSSHTLMAILCSPPLGRRLTLRSTRWSPSLSSNLISLSTTPIQSDVILSHPLSRNPLASSHLPYHPISHPIYLHISILNKALLHTPVCALLLGTSHSLYCYLVPRFFARKLVIGIFMLLFSILPYPSHFGSSHQSCPFVDPLCTFISRRWIQESRREDVFMRLYISLLGLMIYTCYRYHLFTHASYRKLATEGLGESTKWCEIAWVPFILNLRLEWSLL